MSAQYLSDDTAKLVSCIMPTYNRRAFVPHAIRYFLRQDYPNKELIIIDDGSDIIEDLVPVDPQIHYHRLPQKITLGAKLNMACQMSRGDIIVNWDDDDWYAPGRLSYQVNSMQDPHTYICGINKLLYYDVKRKTAFQYVYPAGHRTWLLGSSLCYRKEYWNRNPFADIDVGMDGLFVWKTTAEHIHILPDITFAVHMIHDSNISPKKTDGVWWHDYPVCEIEKIMNGDWSFYKAGQVIAPAKLTDKTAVPRSPVQLSTATIKNVYACLVHENADCIEDLINNLRYHDPDSPVLLYNGGGNTALFNDREFLKRNQLFIFPDPVPVKHGYLHSFALQCMEFCLMHFTFDTLTIVDSDQLCLRRDYTHYLTDFFSTANRAAIGMLSSAPEQVTRENKTNLVAIQAYKEFELWKPLLDSFQDGEEKFVHWTFWPSSVFLVQAIRDLVQLFKENALLQEIMKQTKIWATEEVILPTLVRLLGYEIALNPCTYDFVKYKKGYSIQEIETALTKPDAYWIHPVRRVMNDPLRRMIREKCHNYLPVVEAEEKPDDIPYFRGRPELKDRINKIEGWLKDNEADILINTTLKAFHLFPSMDNIVEIGSYHGKTTILFGTIIQAGRYPAKIFAIDMHDGKLGAADLGLKSYPPSGENFKRNLEEAGLNEMVVPIKGKADQIEWKKPVTLLFVDGLHDYKNAAADFYHFEPWIEPGGFVAFHDYADYFPGVKKLVREILASGSYREDGLADSLIILQKAK